MDLATLSDSATESRSFPSVDALIDALHEGVESTAKALWRFADRAPTGRGAALPRRQPTQAWLARLLSLYREALLAEQAEAWPRADFFWAEVQGEAARLPGGSPLWEEVGQILRDELQVSLPAEGEGVRSSLVQELLLDARAAFYNGRISDSEVPPDDRAFRHAEALEALVDLGGVRDEDRSSLLLGPDRLRISVLERLKLWSKVAHASERALRHFPDSVEFQEALAGATLREALDALGSPEGESQNAAEAHQLQSAIRRLDALRRRFPLRESIFEYLALVHHLRAIRLANSGQLSEALPEVQRALTFRPGMAQAEAARVQMLEALEQLQSQMKKVLQEIARTPNAQLSTQGSKLKREADRGTQPLRAFLESSEAKTIAADLRRARAVGLWQAAGLGPLEEADDGAPEALLDALNAVVESKPSTPDALRRRWLKQSHQHPELASVDAARVIAFLERRLSGNDDENESGAGQPDRTFLSYRGGEANAVARRTTRDPEVQDRELVREWLGSRQSTRFKLQAAAATVVMLLAAGVWGFEIRARSIRDRAYSEATAAATKADHEGAVRASEAFFGVSLRADDRVRERHMQDLYSEEFVRWFAQLDGELDPAAAAHTARYREIVLDSGRAGR